MFRKLCWAEASAGPAAQQVRARSRQDRAAMNSGFRMPAVKAARDFYSPDDTSGSACGAAPSRRLWPRSARRAERGVTLRRSDRFQNVRAADLSTIPCPAKIRDRRVRELAATSRPEVACGAAACSRESTRRSPGAICAIWLSTTLSGTAPHRAASFRSSMSPTCTVPLNCSWSAADPADSLNSAFQDALFLGELGPALSYLPDILEL